MLRLKLNKEEYDIVLLKENELFKLFPKRDIERMKKEKEKSKEFWFSLDYKQELKEYFNTKNLITNYVSFLKIIRNETSKRIPGNFLVVNYNKTLYIFKSDLFVPEYRFVCTYRPESEAIRDFCLKLFRIDDKKNFTILNSSVDNHFAFVTTWQVLEILFTKVDIESSGESLYTTFKKPKKSGGFREIVAPHEKIKAALVDLNCLLQRVYDNRNSSFQIAYKKGKNVKTGALIHSNKKYVFNIDLTDFYPSCKKELVKKYTDFLFLYSFNREFIEEEFFKVIFINDGLFIGSPVSGTLANAVISNAVCYMNNICKKYNMSLSVYADDITFSSDKFIVKDFIVGIFNEAFTKYQLDSYYKLNEKKCVGFSGCNRKVTGLSINDSNKVTVPRKYYRDLRVQIDHLSKGDTNIDLQTLRGKIAYASMVDDSGKIYNYLNKYLATVKQYNLCSDEKLEELKERAGL